LYEKAASGFGSLEKHVSTLHVPSWFPLYLKKLNSLDRPSYEVLDKKLKQIQHDPFSGMQVKDLELIPAPEFPLLARGVIGLFDVKEPGFLSGIPEQAVWCVIGEVLLESRQPPPKPTRVMIVYVPHGLPPKAVNITSLFPAAIPSDVAAVIMAPVWVKSEWLLIDPFSG
jgi:hypothetical protein